MPPRVARKTLQVTVTPLTRARLVAIADREGTTMPEVVREILHAALDAREDASKRLYPDPSE